MSNIYVLDKDEFTIYYDIVLKYPICVIERFNGLHDIGINREKIGEPFKADVQLPKNARLYWNNYKDYMMYGGSPGHNAPAGLHKSSLKKL